MLWNDELGVLTIIIWWWLWSYVSWRCFPHVVNLVCKAVLSTITHIKYAAENAGDYVPIAIGPHSMTFAEVITCDPVATLRSLVRGVHMKTSNADLVYRFTCHLFDNNTFQMSSILFTWRIFSFSLMLTPDGCQLSSCWKGLFYSVLWVTSLAYKFRVYLHGWSKAIKEFLEKCQSNFPELRWFMFSAAEWDALQVFQKILEVSWRLSIFGVAHWLTTLYKVPHAFQQQLSFEKTSTLCDAIPSFDAMVSIWEEWKVNYPDAANIIDAGLGKLDVYRNCAEIVPTYVLAMSKWCFTLVFLTWLSAVIMPTMKLEWYTTNIPDKVEWAKNIFINAVSYTSVWKLTTMYLIYLAYSFAHITTNQPMNRPLNQQMILVWHPLLWKAMPNSGQQQLEFLD